MDVPEHLRLYLSLGLLALFLLWETIWPFFRFFNRRGHDRLLHLIRNLMIAGLNAALVSLAFVGLWAWASRYSEIHGTGLLHRLQLGTWSHALCAILIPDGWTYFWHWLNHRVPLLWRFHRMHHSDAQMDVTTASRFHLGEIAISSLLRIPLILLVGIRLPELIVYEAMMFAVVQFHHANIGLPAAMDRFLRVLIVTPAMHKVHHSRFQPEADGFQTRTAVVTGSDRGARQQRLLPSRRLGTRCPA